MQNSVELDKLFITEHYISELCLKQTFWILSQESYHFRKLCTNKILYDYLFVHMCNWKNKMFGSTAFYDLFRFCYFFVVSTYLHFCLFWLFWNFIAVTLTLVSLISLWYKVSYTKTSECMRTFFFQMLLGFIKNFFTKKSTVGTWGYYFFMLLFFGFFQIPWTSIVTNFPEQ